MLHLSQKGAETTVTEKWYNRKMQVQHGTAVRLGDMVYGSSGGSGPSFFTSIDVRAGEIAVRQRGFSKANLLASGERLLILDEDGEFALATAGKDTFEVHAQAKQGAYHKVLDGPNTRRDNCLPEGSQRGGCAGPFPEVRHGHSSRASTAYLGATR